MEDRDAALLAHVSNHPGCTAPEACRAIGVLLRNSTRTGWIHRLREEGLLAPAAHDPADPRYGRLYLPEAPPRVGAERDRTAQEWEEERARLYAWITALEARSQRDQRLLTDITNDLNAAGLPAGHGQGDRLRLAVQMVISQRDGLQRQAAYDDLSGEG